MDYNKSTKNKTDYYFFEMPPEYKAMPLFQFENRSKQFKLLYRECENILRIDLNYLGSIDNHCNYTHMKQVVLGVQHKNIKDN